ncbi:MAG: nucleoside kinase [Oscillospiraceae bacterium]|nr:nucleoside kinase [Oscillospiraceae bacterium]
MKKFARLATINKKAVRAPDELVQIAEDNYSAYIEEAARMIADKPDKPMVLLSGPSGSGKTTTALRICGKLREWGKNVHTLSMDNYFLPITKESEKDLPRDENGQIDLESPLRLDIPLFSSHLKMLAEGEEIQMPRFDFATQSRGESTPVKRHKNEIIIIEGIHALNPMVTGHAEDFSLGLYVSVRTGLRAEDGALLRPKQVRLMRRLCRDRLFRKRSYRDIFAMSESVSRGEEMYILPHKHRADFDVDTFMAYEPSVYRAVLLDELNAELLSHELDSFPDCGEILRFLRDTSPIDLDALPGDSLIREFVGGSVLEY